MAIAIAGVGHWDEANWDELVWDATPATSAGVASPTLALTATSQIPLAGSAGVATATLALRAPALLALATGGSGSGSFLFSTPVPVELGVSAGESTIFLGLNVPVVLLDPSSGQGSASLALEAQTLLTLISAGVGSGSLAMWTRPMFSLASGGFSQPTLVFSVQDVSLSIVLYPRVFDPGTVVSSFGFQQVEPWCRSSRVPPARYALDSAVVAEDGSVTITGLAGRHNVLWATVHPLLHAPRQQYISFYID